jgi:hypothetical protein
MCSKASLLILRSLRKHLRGPSAVRPRGVWIPNPAVNKLSKSAKTSQGRWKRPRQRTVRTGESVDLSLSTLARSRQCLMRRLDPKSVTGWRLVGFAVNGITKALERRPAVAGFVENELMNSTLRSQKTIARRSRSSQTSQVCDANRAHGHSPCRRPRPRKKSEAQGRP